MKPLASHLTKRLLGAALLSAALITPAMASAQDEAYNQDQQIQGTVAAINGTWNITVSDANGYADNVELHQGTIINPTGLTLEPGMNVTIDGYADGSAFDANEIDTPYQYNGPAPVAVYYGPGAWYPGYAQGWGPSFSLVFDLGTRSWQQRPFAFDGRVRQQIAPPSGWQDRPHGYIGNAGAAQHIVYAPQQRRTFATPAAQSQRAFTNAPVQQQRGYAAPAPRQERPFDGTPTQMQRSFAAPAQSQRQFAAPAQSQRQFAAPAQSQRSFAAPAQSQRQFAAPTQRNSAPAARGTDHRR